MYFLKSSINQNGKFTIFGHSNNYIVIIMNSSKIQNEMLIIRIKTIIEDLKESINLP